MAHVQVLRCETASLGGDGSARTYGECLAGPIREGDRVAVVAHDVGDEEAVAIQVTAVTPAAGAARELHPGGWGSLSLRGVGAEQVSSGDLLATVPPRP